MGKQQREQMRDQRQKELQQWRHWRQHLRHQWEQQQRDLDAKMHSGERVNETGAEEIWLDSGMEDDHFNDHQLERSNLPAENDTTDQLEEDAFTSDLLADLLKKNDEDNFKVYGPVHDNSTAANAIDSSVSIELKLKEDAAATDNATLEDSKVPETATLGTNEDQLKQETAASDSYPNSTWSFVDFPQWCDSKKPKLDVKECISHEFQSQIQNTSKNNVAANLAADDFAASLFSAPDNGSWDDIKERILWLKDEEKLIMAEYDGDDMKNFMDDYFEWQEVKEFKGEVEELFEREATKVAAKVITGSSSDTGNAANDDSIPCFEDLSPRETSNTPLSNGWTSTAKDFMVDATTCGATMEDTSSDEATESDGDPCLKHSVGYVQTNRKIKGSKWKTFALLLHITP